MSRRLTGKEREVICDILQDSFKHGVNITFKRSTIKNGRKISIDASYDQHKKVIEIGTNKIETSDLLHFLVHEYNHSVQDRLQTSAWKAADRKVSETYGTNSDVFYWWMEGKKFDKEKVKWAFIYNRNMELECERMSAKLLKKYGLSVDRYIQDANLYMYSLAISHKYRLWDFKHPLCEIEGIYEVTPKRFCKTPNEYDFDNIPPKVLKKIKDAGII